MSEINPQDTPLTLKFIKKLEEFKEEYTACVKGKDRYDEKLWNHKDLFGYDHREKCDRIYVNKISYLRDDILLENKGKYYYPNNENRIAQLHKEYHDFIFRRL